jgi:SAM-dependent methyltransferase
MGDPKQKATFLQGLIKSQTPRAETLLELACGTGAVLRYFIHDFDVAGLDLSAGMLSIARKRLPKIPFFRQDMTKFSIPRKFDAILCVYDSINHLKNFSDWRKVFARSKFHLNKNGVFIFDVNTEHKLKSFSESPAWIHKFGKNYLAMKVEGKPHGPYQLEYQGLRKHWRGQVPFIRGKYSRESVSGKQDFNRPQARF